MSNTSYAVGTDIYGGAFTGKVATSSGSLNVRDEATTNAQINASLARNSTHTFTSQYIGGNNTYARAWLLHYPNGAGTTPDGYVSAQYISWIPSYGEGECFSTEVEVAADEYVNLRQTPSKSATSIYRLHNGDPVLVLHAPDVPVSGWTHIATAGGTGWIMTEFLALRG